LLSSFGCFAAGKANTPATGVHNCGGFFY